MQLLSSKPWYVHHCYPSPCSFHHDVLVCANRCIKTNVYFFLHFFKCIFPVSRFRNSPNYPLSAHVPVLYPHAVNPFSARTAGRPKFLLMQDFLLQRFDAYIHIVQLVSALIRAAYLYTVLFCLSYINQGFFIPNQREMNCQIYGLFKSLNCDY